MCKDKLKEQVLKEDKKDKEDKVDYKETIYDYIEDMEFDDIVDHLLDGGFADIFDDNFTREQRVVLISVIAKIVDMMKYHIYEEETPHLESIGKQIDSLDNDLNSHRHKLDEKYSAKPEF